LVARPDAAMLPPVTQARENRMRCPAFTLLLALVSAPAFAQDQQEQGAVQDQQDRGAPEEVATPPGPDPCPTGDVRCLAQEVRALRAEVARARLDHTELAKTLDDCATMLQGYGETQKELLDLYEGLAASLDRVEQKLAGDPAGRGHTVRPPVARPRSKSP
jgi:hypothetical protein